MNNSNFRLALSGLALGVLLALFIAPQTRWLVRLQTLPPSLVGGTYEQQKKQFVNTHPSDYPVQLAGQTTNSSTQTQVQYARSLVSRFPESASLRANILRYALGNFHLYRAENFQIADMPVPTQLADPKYPPPTAIRRHSPPCSGLRRRQPGENILRMKLKGTGASTTAFTVGGKRSRRWQSLQASCFRISSTCGRSRVLLPIKQFCWSRPDTPKRVWHCGGR